MKSFYNFIFDPIWLMPSVEFLHFGILVSLLLTFQFVASLKYLTVSTKKSYTLNFISQIMSGSCCFALYIKFLSVNKTLIVISVSGPAWSFMTIVHWSSVPFEKEWPFFLEENYRNNQMVPTLPLLDLCPEEPAWEKEAALYWRYFMY